MDKVRRLLVVTAALGLAAGIVACSTVTVSTDFDPAAAFGQYKTFGFAPMKEFNDIVAGRVETAITQALEGRGLKKAAEKPDLVVEVAAKISNQKQVTSTGWGGYGWGGYRWGGGTSTATVQEIPVGTLLVGLVDASTNKLVWRGSATKTIDEGSTGPQKQVALNDAMVKLFAGFPPGSGK